MDHVLVTRVERTATITLNRPTKLNAFAGRMREELLEALRQLGTDDGARAVIITGAGRGFCAGGDVPYMAELQREARVDEFRNLLDLGARIVRQIREMPKIVIAAVNGVAAGAGCNLALACDYRLAARSARFSQAFVKIGLHSDWGGTWSLPRLVGPARALEILATGRMVDAEEALLLGMVDRVVENEQLESESRVLAARIASGPSSVIGDIKRAVWAALDNDLTEQLELETGNQLRAFASRDGKEGVRAFLEKRAPVFD